MAAGFGGGWTYHIDDLTVMQTFSVAVAVD